MDFTEALRRAVEYQLLGLHTAAPGRVESYDPATQRAKVKPLVPRVYADGQVQEQAILTSVPVIFPRTAAGSLTFQVARGDTVLLVFCERSIEEFLVTGGGSPSKSRHHDLSDAVAIPGLFPFLETSPGAAGADMRLEARTAELNFNGGKVALGAAGVEVLALLSQTLQALGTATVTVDGSPTPLNNAADFIALKAQLDSIKGSLS
jgi:hypothetical protein